MAKSAAGQFRPIIRLACGRKRLRSFQKLLSYCCFKVPDKALRVTNVWALRKTKKYFGLSQGRLCLWWQGVIH